MTIRSIRTVSYHGSSQAELVQFAGINLCLSQEGTLAKAPVDLRRTNLRVGSLQTIPDVVAVVVAGACFTRYSVGRVAVRAEVAEAEVEIAIPRCLVAAVHPTTHTTHRFFRDTGQTTGTDVPSGCRVSLDDRGISLCISTTTDILSYTAIWEASFFPVIVVFFV